MSQKHADPSNGGLFWKSLLPFFTRTYALSVGFKMKPLRKRFSSVKKKNQPKFCCKTCCKEQPFIFAVYFMNHIFQTSVFLIQDNGMYNRTWLYKHMKNFRSSQPAILVLNWMKQFFPVSIVKETTSIVKLYVTDLFVSAMICSLDFSCFFSMHLLSLNLIYKTL